MKTASQLALLAVGASAAVALYLMFADGDGKAPATPGESHTAATATDASAARGTIPEAPHTAERTTVDAPVAADAWLDHPFVMELAVHIVDPFGLPVEGHQVRLTPFGGALNEADHATGPDGTVLLTWHARTSTMQIEIADPRDQLRRVTLTSGKRTELTLLGSAEEGPTLNLVFSSDTQVATGNGPPVLSGVPIRFVMNGGNNGLGMHQGLHPFAVFGDRVGRREELPSADPSGPGISLSFGGANGIRLSGATFTSIQSERAGADTAPVAPSGVVAGVVYGDDGKPAPKVLVALLGQSPQPMQRVRTDDEGNYKFDGLQPGDFTVRAGGDREGLATVPAKVTTGTTPTNLQLQRGSCARGRALDEHQKPLVGATVEWRNLDGTWSDATTTADDGTFVVANLPGGPGRMLLFAPQRDPKIPVAIAPSVLPDSGETVLRAAATGSLSLEVVKPAELAKVPNNALTIRAWQVETDLGIRVPRPDKGDVWKLGNLAAGDYDVELRFPGGGRRDCGRHWIDGEHPLDLGRVELPCGGRVHTALRPEQQPAAESERAVEITSLRADADVSITPLPADDQDLWLPVGDYALAWRGRDGAVHFERFHVAKNERAVVPAPK